MAALIKLSSGPNFTVFRNGDSEEKCIKIDNVRFSYPHFGHKQAQEGESGEVQESWGGVAMLPKTTHVAAKDAFQGILKELLEKNKAKVDPANRCLKNGDDKEDENMAGHWLITFKEGRNRPAVRDTKGGVILDADKIDEMFYGGVWGSVLLRPWYFGGKSKKSTKPFPKRLCCGFTGVQFLKNDTPFGQGRVDDTEAWGSVATAGDDDGWDDSSSDDDL